MHINFQSKVTGGHLPRGLKHMVRPHNMLGVPGPGRLADLFSNTRARRLLPRAWPAYHTA